MIVMCCYANNGLGGHVGLQDATKAVVLAAGGYLVDVAGDPEGYWKALNNAWDMGHGFINVEQDIVPTLEQLRELAECPADWCSFPTTIMGTLANELGCVKFSEALTLRYHGGLQGVGRTWWGLDSGIYHRLAGWGVRRHVHPGSVKHLNPHHTGQLA